MAFSKIIFNGTTLMDVTQDTVAAGNLLQGETATGADGEQVTGAYVPGGEAGQEDLTIDAGVVFIDYDGIIVEEWNTADVAGKTALPNNPSHSGLTAQGWNYTLANIKTYIANYPDAILVVGQMYITTSGATEIDVVLSSDTLQPYLGIAPNGTVTVDWGDNSTTSTLTGTSLTSLKWANHTYTTGGEYTIKLTVASGSFNFYGTTNGYGSILSRTNSFNYSHLYNNTIRAIRLGSSAGIGAYGVVTSYMLQTISIPKTADISGQYAFNSNYMLRCIVVPNGTTTLGQYWSAYSYGLHFVSVPQEVTSIGTYAHVNNNFIKAYSVPQGVATISSYTLNGFTNAKRITFPDSVTSIASNGANNTYSLNRLTIPSSITSLQTSCLANMRSLYKLRFEKTTPPTVSSSNVWTNLGTWCVISVPTGSLSSYTSASNYPSSSSYTYIEEA